jgi:hypothetical protein
MDPVSINRAPVLTLWVVNLSDVRQYPLELPVPLEVQIDQFCFERGETPPRGR